jgi:asparagine synthase (glutamine-hydrolysing)
MCGIAGVIDVEGRRPDDERLVDGMLRALAHRGPDDQHALSDDHSVIGARRLSIIDVEGGRQPLTDEHGRFVITNNGEIYNYLELAAPLRAAGHRFASHGDTETAVHLYEERGDRFVEALRGMYALAVWDRTRRRLTLVRDRLGKKPLYWRFDGSRLAYASELKALLQDPETPRDVDRVALAQYLEYGYVPAPRTIIEGIHKLPPGSILTFEGGEPEVHRYWSPPVRVAEERPFEEDLERCLDLLRESVRLRLRSDVPVGLFLSGGMDSSTVLALVSQLGHDRVKTFSIGFRHARFDELPYARLVAERFGTEHHEAVVDLDAIELLPSLSFAFDEPFADASAIPTFRVAQLAATDVKVVLTGDGGDESFGGYDRYLKHAATRAPSGPVGTVVTGAASLAGRTLRAVAPGATVTRRTRTWLRLAEMSDDQRYISLMEQSTRAQRAALLASDPLADQDGYLRSALEAGPEQLPARLMRADMLTYLPEDLLVKMDRATMANSIEARSPLLDQELVEFMATRPADRRIRRRQTKVLLRAAARELLPSAVLERPKMGFGVPIDDWFRGDLGVAFEELVLAPDSRIRDHLDVDTVRGMHATHVAGTQDLGANLWALLMFESWARRWLSPPVDATADRVPVLAPS